MDDLKAALAQLRSGDSAALGRIYELLRTPVFTVIVRIVGQRETAEDVTQDLFMRLLAAPPGAEVKNPRAWIFRCAHNLAVDTLRTQHPTNALPDTVPSPDTADGTALRLDIERAFAALTPEERAAVTLHLNAGLSFGEIATVLGRSLPSVYRTYRRALVRLRILLNGGTL